MKIAYIANARIPTEKAHGAQIMNTCSALSRAGAEVELIIPKRSNRIGDNPFSFYGLDDSFSIKSIFSIDLLETFLPKFFSFFIETLTFTLSAVAIISSSPRRNHMIYGRDEAVLAFLSLFSKNIYWETHTGSTNIFARILLARARGIVCISRGLADLYLSMGASRDHILVAHDGIDMRKFENIPDDKNLLRKKLGLPMKVSIVTYSGSIGLYSWKGVDVFLGSLEMIDDSNLRFVVVGGSSADVEKMKVSYPDSRIIFVKSVRPEEVPLYLKASDALVLPNKSGNIVSERYTSPMKLFEYMASNRPIIASDLPSMREILNTNSAVLFTPNDPNGLADVIRSVLGDQILAQKIAKQAYVDAKNHTWSKRAEAILNFIGK